LLIYIYVVNVKKKLCCCLLSSLYFCRSIWLMNEQKKMLYLNICDIHKIKYIYKQIKDIKFFILRESSGKSPTDLRAASHRPTLKQLFLLDFVAISPTLSFSAYTAIFIFPLSLRVSIYCDNNSRPTSGAEEAMPRGITCS